MAHDEADETTETGKPEDDVPDSAARRISERLGDPLLFAFLSIVVTREWRFWYALIRGEGPVKETVAYAATLISTCQLVVDFALAVLFTAAWPWLHLGVKWYGAFMRQRLQNTLRRVREGKLNTLAELAKHPKYVRARLDLEILHEVARTSMHEDALVQGSIPQIVRLGPERPTIPGFARLVGAGDGSFATAVPTRSTDSGPLVYLIDEIERMKVKGRGVGLAICASDQASVPWPKGAPPEEMFAAPDGGLSAKEQKQGEAITPRLARLGDGRGRVQTGVQPAKRR